jgi:hypothetical protein
MRTAVAEAQAETFDFGIPINLIGLAAAGEVGFERRQIGANKLDAFHGDRFLGSAGEAI